MLDNPILVINIGIRLEEIRLLLLPLRVKVSDLMLQAEFLIAEGFDLVLC